MECIFFPLPGFFDSHMPALIGQDASTEIGNALGYDDNALTDNERCDKQKAKLRHDWEEELYIALEENPIAVADESVTFC
jgi:hypothetical protein